MEKPIFYFTIILIILAAVGFFLIYPLYSEMMNLKSKLDNRKEALANKSNYFSKLREFKNQLKEFPEEIEKIKSAIPEDSGMLDMASFLISEASANGLSLDNISVGNYIIESQKDDSDVKKSSLDISVSGKYSSLKSFISSIQKNSRLIEIDNISLEGASGVEGSGNNQKVTTDRQYFKFNISLSFNHY